MEGDINGQPNATTSSPINEDSRQDMPAECFARRNGHALAIRYYWDNGNSAVILVEQDQNNGFLISTLQVRYQSQHHQGKWLSATFKGTRGTMAYGILRGKLIPRAQVISVVIH